MKTAELKINYSDNHDCYWNAEGDNAKYLQACWDVFVPASGEAIVPEGELARGYSRIVYDVYNNGGCNLYDDNKRKWREMYDMFISQIRLFLLMENVSTDNLDKVYSLAPKYRFNHLWEHKKFTKALCHLGDEVVYVLQKRLRGDAQD